jgi:hypothetical protein
LIDTAFATGASASAVVPVVDVLVLLSVVDVDVVELDACLSDLPPPCEVEAVVADGFFVEDWPAPVDLPDAADWPEPVDVPAFGPCVV